MLGSSSRLSSDTRSYPADNDICSRSPLLATTDKTTEVNLSVNFEINVAVTNILTYIGGYLAYQIHNDLNISFDHCTRALVNAKKNVVEESQTHTHLKANSQDKGAFGGLTAPPTQKVRILTHRKHIFLKDQHIICFIPCDTIDIGNLTLHCGTVDSFVFTMSYARRLLHVKQKRCRKTKAILQGYNAKW